MLWPSEDRKKLQRACGALVQDLFKCNELGFVLCGVAQEDDGLFHNLPECGRASGAYQEAIRGKGGSKQHHETSTPAHLRCVQLPE
jgi:hypothetical protein